MSTQLRVGRNLLSHAPCFKEEMLSHQISCLFSSALLFLILLRRHACCFSNSSRACPQGMSCQCILPTRQYFQGAHVFLILPHGFTLDKPLSNAPLTSMLLLSSPWSGPEVHKHSYGWPQRSITCLGLLENEQFLFHLWS